MTLVATLCRALLPHSPALPRAPSHEVGGGGAAAPPEPLASLGETQLLRTFWAAAVLSAWAPGGAAEGGAEGAAALRLLLAVGRAAARRAAAAAAVRAGGAGAWAPVHHAGLVLGLQERRLRLVMSQQRHAGRGWREGEAQGGALPRDAQQGREEGVAESRPAGEAQVLDLSHVRPLEHLAMGMPPSGLAGVQPEHSVLPSPFSLEEVEEREEAAEEEELLRGGGAGAQGASHDLEASRRLGELALRAARQWAADVAGAADAPDGNGGGGRGGGGGGQAAGARGQRAAGERPPGEDEDEEAEEEEEEEEEVDAVSGQVLSVRRRGARLWRLEVMQVRGGFRLAAPTPPLVGQSRSGAAAIGGACLGGGAVFSAALPGPRSWASL